jgi:acyl-CoA thioesterase FadM
MVPVFEADLSNRKDLRLDRQSFQTSMEDSNLVGNIYYSNYYSWQARLIDKYLYAQLPDMFKQDNEGEFICVGSEVSHLQEAMPFETIEVSMYLHDLFEEGFTLYFEYHSVNEEQEKRKLAHGKHTAIWTLPDLYEKEIRPMKMPETFFDNLKMMIAEEIDFTDITHDTVDIEVD